MKYKITLVFDSRKERMETSQVLDTILGDVSRHITKYITFESCEVINTKEDWENITNLFLEDVHMLDLYKILRERWSMLARRDGGSEPTLSKMKTISFICAQLQSNLQNKGITLDPKKLVPLPEEW